jgi:hypothetical protein
VDRHRLGQSAVGPSADRDAGRLEPFGAAPFELAQEHAAELLEAGRRIVEDCQDELAIVDRESHVASGGDGVDECPGRGVGAVSGDTTPSGRAK